MATIEERSNDDGSVAYRVKIRLKGRRQVSETFQRKTDARIWAQRTESELRRGRLLGLRRTVGEAIDHYLQHELALLAQSEKRHRIRHLGWWRDRLGSKLLEEIGPADAREALRALEGRKVATVNRYRAALSAVLSVAVEEEWIASHPLHRARRRKRPNAEREVERDREVTREEMEALKAACRLSEDSRFYALVVFAYASGAREGELMRMEWSRAELSPTILDPVTRETSRSRFIPCKIVELLNLDWISYIRVAGVIPEVAEREQLGAIRQRARITMQSGYLLEGQFLCLLPGARARLSDLLNVSTDRFLLFIVPAAVLYVNRKSIVRIVP